MNILDRVTECLDKLGFVSKAELSGQNSYRVEIDRLGSLYVNQTEGTESLYFVTAVGNISDQPGIDLLACINDYNGASTFTRAVCEEGVISIRAYYPVFSEQDTERIISLILSDMLDDEKEDILGSLLNFING